MYFHSHHETGNGQPHDAWLQQERDADLQRDAERLSRLDSLGELDLEADRLSRFDGHEADYFAAERLVVFGQPDGNKPPFWCGYFCNGNLSIHDLLEVCSNTSVRVCQNIRHEM